LLSSEITPPAQANRFPEGGEESRLVSTNTGFGCVHEPSPVDLATVLYSSCLEVSLIL